MRLQVFADVTKITKGSLVAGFERIDCLCRGNPGGDGWIALNDEATLSKSKEASS